MSCEDLAPIYFGIPLSFVIRASSFPRIRAICSLPAVVGPLPDKGGLSVVSSVFTDYLLPTKHTKRRKLRNISGQILVPFPFVFLVCFVGILLIMLFALSVVASLAVRDLWMSLATPISSLQPARSPSQVPTSGLRFAFLVL